MPRWSSKVRQGRSSVIECLGLKRTGLCQGHCRHSRKYFMKIQNTNSWGEGGLIAHGSVGVELFIAFRPWRILNMYRDLMFCDCC
jgi:hypothetical protein